MKIVGANNDLSELFPQHVFCGSPEELLAVAEEKEAVIFTAENYPSLPGSPVLTEDFLKSASQKKLRIYVEYPDGVGSLKFSMPEKLSFERTLLFRDLGELKKGTILAHHGCRLKKSGAVPREIYLVSALVAGYRQAVFGIPDNADPILFRHPDYDNVLVAATALSCFRRARFAPMETWRKIWQFILDDLGADVEMPAWKMSVRPAYGKDDPLPPDAEKKAFDNNVRWLDHWNISSHDGPLVAEGFDSLISSNGTQRAHTRERSDNVAMSAMVLAFDWELNGNVESYDTACAIIDRLFRNPANICLDASSPCYGQMSFYENVPIYYGSGNSLSVIGLLAAEELLGRKKHLKEMLRCLLSVLRTTGKYGFRRPSFKLPDAFEVNPPEWYADEEFILKCPHRQAAIWTGFLLAWQLTGYGPFMEKAKTGLQMTMESFPDLNWMNGLSQEFARLLLPLAMLVRCEDTPLHRQWLEKCADALLKLMTEDGALKESLGKRELGHFPPPDSNEKYGKSEASLIQQEGDAGCDTLYTTGFALLGFHEAARATGEEKYRAAADRLCRFTLRIQAKSEEHPELSGAWIRGFDCEMWDFWGSSADFAWGAWCTETGWGNAMNAAVLALRHLDRSIFDLAGAHSMREFLAELLAEQASTGTEQSPVKSASGAVLGAER